jgi:tetratricopeptide (TPR) repeat protein/transcriptional regulator with XRE-family HTH domain
MEQLAYTSPPPITLRKSTGKVRLVQQRIKRRWSQQQLADLVGATPLTISRWERGETVPGPFLREKLCNIFQMSAEELGLIPVVGERAPLTSIATKDVEVVDPALPLPFANAADLIGRQDILVRLKQRLLSGKTPNATALVGLPGVGKTTIAIALVHDLEVAAAFRGGVLWASLGPDPNLLAHLSRMGALLGISPEMIGQQGSAEGFTLQLRQAIGMRRFLIVVDDVWSLAHAYALRVGGARTDYLLTTRFPEVASAFALDGVLYVDELTEEAGVALLGRLAPKAVQFEPHLARKLVQATGALPLALTLMGHYLRAQSFTGQPRRLKSALRHLADHQGRLGVSEPQAYLERSPGLPMGEPLSLKSVIATSVSKLDEQAREALYALSAFPAKPNSFAEDTAQHVSGVGLAVLDRLWDMGLLESRGEGRYALHATITDYARSLSTDPAPQVRLATTMASYIESHVTDFSTLELESDNVFAALEFARDLGLSQVFVRLVLSFAHFLEARGMGEQEEVLLEQAYSVALTVPDSQSLATVMLYLGRIAQWRGQYTRASDSYQQGLNWARQTGDSALIAHLLRNLGVVADSQGEYAKAEGYFTEALALARMETDQSQVPLCLSSLGLVAFKRGADELAENYWREGLVLAQCSGNKEQECYLLLDIANIAMNRRHFVEADDLLQQALVLARELGHLELTSGILGNLGENARRSGAYDQAEPFLLEALQRAQEIGHHIIAVYTKLELGELYLLQCRLQAAETLFHEILQSTPDDNQELTAKALYGLARRAAADGDLDAAREHAAVCLERFASIAHPQETEVRNWLHTLDASTERQA